MRVTPRIGVTALFVCLAAPRVGSGQAWLAPEGDVSVGLLYQGGSVSHVNLAGDVDRAGLSGRMDAHVLLPRLGYSFSDKVALGFEAAYVYGRYRGDNPHPSSLDDGSYHGTLADYRFELRYQAMRSPAVITPFVAVVIPSHRYEYRAHAYPGLRLYQYTGGAYIGKSLDPIAGYVHGGISYTVLERTLGIPHDRASASLEGGYFVTPSWGVRVFTAGGYGLGGWKSDEVPKRYECADPEEKPCRTPGPEYERWTQHDRLLRSKFWEGGLGVSYRFRDVVLSASFRRTLWARDFVATDAGFSFGVGWSFSLVD